MPKKSKRSVSNKKSTSLLLSNPLTMLVLISVVIAFGIYAYYSWFAGSSEPAPTGIVAEFEQELEAFEDAFTSETEAITAAFEPGGGGDDEYIELVEKGAEMRDQFYNRLIAICDRSEGEDLSEGAESLRMFCDNKQAGKSCLDGWEESQLKGLEYPLDWQPSGKDECIEFVSTMVMPASCEQAFGWKPSTDEQAGIDEITQYCNSLP